MTSILIFLASILLTTSDASSEDTKDLEARWRRDYPLAAEKWEALSREFVAKGRYSFRWFDGDTVVSKEFTAASSGGKKLFSHADVTTLSPDLKISPTQASVECQTEEFVFKLTKMPSSKSYMIQYFQPNPHDPDSEFEAEFRRFSRCATTYSGYSLSERMENPAYVLKSVEALDQGGRKLVQIIYTRQDKDGLQVEQIDLDPAINWAIRSVKTTFTSYKSSKTSERSRVVDYKQVDDTQFFPVRMEFFDREPDPKIFQHGVLEYDQVTLGRPPDSLFRLSAYGLPDLPLRPSPRASVFTLRNPVLWLAFAATVASFALLWFMRSRKVRAA